MIIYYVITLVLLSIICICLYKLFIPVPNVVGGKMSNKNKKNKVLKKYSISGATLKDGKCKLFQTKTGEKIAVCRKNDKILVFELED